MDLELIWFVLLGFLLAGYAILDGFDLGVGILHPLLNKAERNVSIKAIGPLWDGNEVWLVTFGGALFAAFREAYSTILSAFYLPIMLLLACLILRAVTVDFRNKVDSKFWKWICDAGFFLSSFGATFVFGVAAGNLLQGIPIGIDGEFSGTTFDLLGFYPLSCGVFAIVTFAMHGFAFLILKTTEALRAKLNNWIWHIWGVFLATYILISMLTLIENELIVEKIRSSYWPIPFVLLNVLAVANLPRCFLSGRFGQAFISSAVTIACLVAIFCFSIFPDIVVGAAGINSWSIYDASSSEKTLGIMLIIAAIGMPMVIAYTSVVYWTFRKPIAIDD